jgi:protocatechuate 3,4-dioxygenase beta subunit
LKKASVWLETFSATRGVNGERSVALPATITDAEGRFALSGIEPGNYLLMAQRIGYLDQGFGAADPQVVGPPLSLAPGETRREVILKLQPQSFVYGKVVDEDGDPVPGARVDVLKRRGAEVAAADSQDDGSFVIGNLAPGSYQLRATLPPQNGQSGRERYVPTYLPDPVDVAPAQAVHNLVIALRKSRVYSLRGRVVPADRASLRLDDARGFTTGTDGRFEFDAVLPGTHEIRTAPNAGGLVGRATVVVTDGDLEDLVLRLGEGATVTGAVKGMASGRIEIGEASADIKSDGSFELANLLPGVHPFELDGIPEGSYVRAVEFAGRPVEDWRLDLTSGAGGELLILLSPDAGEISGVVPNSPGALVQVWPAGGDTARSMKADARGAFRFHSIPPGDYLVAAFENLDDDLARLAPFRALFERAAVKVKVAEKSRERVELKLIVRDVIAAEAAKLR